MRLAKQLLDKYMHLMKYVRYNLIPKVKLRIVIIEQLIRASLTVIIEIDEIFVSTLVFCRAAPCW